MNAFPIILLAMICLGTSALAQSRSLLTLNPRPKVAFERPGIRPPFKVSRAVPLLLSDYADEGTYRAMALLQRKLNAAIGDTLPWRRTNDQYNQSVAVATVAGMDSAISRQLLRTMPWGESMPSDPGSYALDISAGSIVVIGADAEGAFNGIETLAQLMNASHDSVMFFQAHIIDYPDYPVRWVFSQHNLRGTNAITAIRSIMDTMAAYKLNGFQQNDFKYAILAEQPDFYFDSVDRFTAIALERNIEIIPGVAGIGYSSGLLWHDPNLAEGFPASALYIVEGDTGRLIPDPRVALPNSGFEQVDANGKFTGWSFYDGQYNDSNVSVDRTIFHSGTASARCENFRTGDQTAIGNCRFSRRVDCRPYRHYLLSAWVRTQDLDCDDVKLLAIGSDDNGNSRTLTFTAFSLPATTAGWANVEVAFNTLEFNHVQLYAGVWGGRQGTIWWDDVRIIDGGLTNVLRRAGAPLIIRDKTTGEIRQEGRDIAPIVDAAMQGSHGSYGPYHDPPTVRRLSNGAVNNGDTLMISFHHPLTTVGDTQGNGSVMVCVSEDTLYTLLADEIGRVDELYRPKKFFLGHDEIRSMNRDWSCRQRELSPADLLADNLKRCVAIIDTTHPGAETFVWSDMFDSLHNARNDYYLIQGDLTGVWNSIPRSTTIVNWNSGAANAGLKRFADLGFSQVTSPYYDTRNTANMRRWRLAMEGVERIRGMMYTTWAGDYSFLPQFAYYAWGAGPSIIHRQLDTAAITYGMPGDSVRMEATALPDPYDPGDRIERATARFTVEAPQPTSFEVEMRRESGDLFVGYVHGLADITRFRYQFTAVNTQKLTRETPEYLVDRSISDSPQEPSSGERPSIEVWPTPAAALATLRIRFPRPGAWEARIVDALGHAVLVFTGTETLPGHRTLAIDLDGIPPGSYFCTVRTEWGTAAMQFPVVQ